ncbi:MAG: LUD domain-containing protein [Salinirussus sp.]
MSRSDERTQKAAEIRHLLDTEGESVYENATVLNDRRYDALDGFEEYDDLRSRAREIKETAIEHLPSLIERVEESVAENGGRVYVADDAADANRYIEDVVQAADAESLVKSKSMTTEEIEVNEALEAVDVEVIETDLGEFVLQIADEHGSHIVAPAIHKSREEIATLLNDVYDPDEPLETAAEMTQFVRDILGERIRQADVGMTGANFVLAESGTITLITNEGNARKTAVTPDTHIAVAGVEKIIPSVDDLTPFLELISKSATGQPLSQYVTMLSPPVETPRLDFDSPDVEQFGAGSEASSEGREFHLVLIDNGRMSMREDDDLRETLYCIRCGACSNSCANFQHVGGHAFGGETYSGGIATGWEAGVEGQDTAAEFNDLCTGCSRCVNACPVKIDIPWINTVVRDRINRDGDPGSFDFLVDGLTPDAESGGLDLGKRLFGNFGTLARIGSATAPLSNWIADTGPARVLMERVFGIDRRRSFPQFRRETFRDWYEQRGSKVADPDREVVLFPDVYTNHVRVGRGKAAVRVLEALGVGVIVPEGPESGRAPLSQGMIATAKDQASAVYAALAEHVDADRDVVVIEPSDLAMFRNEYTRLLPDRSAERLGERSYEVLEYVYGLLENGADSDGLAGGDGTEVAYHGHCQQRTLGLDVYTEAVLSRLDYRVHSSDVECCGMAGSFGYKTEYYDLSMDVGEPLADQLREVDGPLVASGTSCLEQFEALFERDPHHPVELLDPGTEV